MRTAAIMANPASGKDIRRLVAHGSVFDNQEKVRMVRRILVGLAAAGVRDVLYMPEGYGIVPRALGDAGVDAHVAVARHAAVEVDASRQVRRAGTTDLALVDALEQGVDRRRLAQ